MVRKRKSDDKPSSDNKLQAMLSELAGWPDEQRDDLLGELDRRLEWFREMAVISRQRIEAMRKSHEDKLEIIASLLERWQRTRSSDLDSYLEVAGQLKLVLRTHQKKRGVDPLVQGDTVHHRNAQRGQNVV